MWGRKIIAIQKYIEGEQNLQPQTMSSGYKDYFRPIIFKKQQTGETLWKLSISYSLARDIYVCKGNLYL